MNWSPPQPETFAPPAPPAPSPPDDECSDETDAERRRRSAVPAAAWVALLGSALIISAAIAVVASNWNSIGQGLRVAGLFAVTAAFLFAAERARPFVPTTAGVTAHVGTFLTAFVGIATMSLFGFTWPVCLVVGGAIGIVATEFQSNRWRRITMHLGQVTGFAMVATGIAAVAATTAGLVAALFAVGLLAAGAQRRAASLSILAVLSPVLAALAEAGIGAGTFERAGLVGERLSWSGPIVGLLAATVLGAVAMQRRNNPLMLVAVASPLFGLVTGLAAVDGSAVAWWSVPALALIAAELGWWLMPTDRFRIHVGSIITSYAGVLAGLAWLSPALVQLELFDSELAHPWAVPVAVTALALALTSLRWKADDSVMTDLGIAAVLACGIGLLVALDASTWFVAAGAIAATAAAAFVSRRLGVVAIHATAFWAVISIVGLPTDDDVTTLVGALGLLATLVGVVVVTRSRLAATNGPLGWLEMSLVTATAAMTAIEIVPDHGPAVGLATVALIMMAVTLVERSFLFWGVLAVGATGAIALDAALRDGTIDSTYNLGWVVATIAFATLWIFGRSHIASFAAAASATLALATAAPALGVSLEDLTVMAMLAVATLTGLAFTVQRRSPLDPAAITAGLVVLATTTFDIDPAWASGAWVVIGLQIAAYGVITSVRPVVVGGIGVALAGTASWWFTSGLNDWFIEAIEPAHITVGDVWLAGASLFALIAGVSVRSTMQVNSWVAYTASLLIPGMWLVSVHVERDTVWAIPLMLTIGIVATAVGAWTRLAAPLVGGTTMTVLGVFLATGSDLTVIPTWIWLAVGGIGLLAVAVLIERTGRPGTADITELIRRWN